MKSKIGYGLLTCAALAGCAGKPVRPSTASASPGGADWRRVATAEDRERLRGWRDAWMTALAKARGSGSDAAINAEGGLFLPDRSLSAAMPPPGRYHCRVFKLGANGSATKNFTAYPYFDCRIDGEGDVSSFYKTSGSQRPVGLLFPDNPARTIFLGTLVLGDEKTALEYGRDADRDLVGILDRVGPARWRLALPYPRFESILDVIELVPAP